MASSLNRVYIMGQLTRDPTTRRLNPGSTVGDLALAITDSYRNKQGENVETVCYVDVVAWNRQAEVCETYLHKGSTVLIEGRLQLDQWTDKDEKKRTKLRVRADRVHFMDKAPKKKESPEPQPEPVPA